MGELSFPRRQRLKKPSDFRTVFDRGAKRHTRSFVFFRRPNELGMPRLGLAVGRKLGGAVTRNRVKRLLREAFRLNRGSLGLGGADLVVVAKRGAERLSFDEIAREFCGALSRAGR